MQLEEIYEAQLYPQQTDPKEKLQKSFVELVKSLGVVESEFLKIYLQYNDFIKQDKFYETGKNNLLKIQDNITRWKEKLIKDFLKYPHLNHPNNETRKDLV